MYIMLQTRPDIAFAVSTVSQFAQNPNTSHYNAVKRIFRYLAGSTDLGVTYGTTDQGLIGYTDADWCGCRDTRKSTGAYLFLLYGGPISWCSKRQQTVALSSTEAEYMAETQATKEAIWLRCFLTEIGVFHDDVVVIRADNNGAMDLARNPEFHARTKHIDIQYHFVREAIDRHLVDFEFVPTAEQAADGLTKALPAVKFNCFLVQSGLILN